MRNRLKIEAFVTNAAAYLQLSTRPGEFSDYLWEFTGGRVLRRRPRSAGDFRASSRESDAMSRDLKRRGFRFVGTTICYAFMQAVGMVDEHQRGCWAAGPPAAGTPAAGTPARA